MVCLRNVCINTLHKGDDDDDDDDDDDGGDDDDDYILYIYIYKISQSPNFRLNILSLFIILPCERFFPKQQIGRRRQMMIMIMMPTTDSGITKTPNFLNQLNKHHHNQRGWQTEFLGILVQGRKKRSVLTHAKIQYTTYLFQNYSHTMQIRDLGWELTIPDIKQPACDGI